MKRSFIICLTKPTWGAIGRGCNGPWGNCPGTIGIGGNCPGENGPGGYQLEGNFPGGNCPRPRWVLPMSFTFTLNFKNKIAKIP